jgi:DNA-binding PadR family transcriptional regulator
MGMYEDDGPGFGGPGFGPGKAGWHGMRGHAQGFAFAHGPGWGGHGGERGGGHHGPRRGAGGPPWAWWGGHGRRFGRADVRAAILALLAEAPRHGYEIMQEAVERSQGAWRPSPGSVYPTLQQLEDEGLIRAEAVDGRRVYHLTDRGREHAERRREELAAVWESVAGRADEGALRMRSLVMQVVAAAMQVTHAGSAGQVEQAVNLLTDTRRRLYRLLAEDGSDGGPTDED